MSPAGEPSMTEVENAAHVPPTPTGADAPTPVMPNVPVLTERGPKIWLVHTLCVVAAVLGATTLAITWVVTEQHFDNGWLAVVFAVGIAALQIMPVNLSHEGQGESLYLEEAFLVAAALFLSPFEALVASGCAVGVGHLWHHRGLLKTSFNTGTFVTSAGIGLAVSRWLGASTGDVSSRAIMAATVGVLVFAVCSMLAVRVIISVISQTRMRSNVFAGIEVRAATWASALAVGILVAAAMDRHLWTLPVTILPIAGLQLIYSRAFGQYRERRQIEQLFTAASSIRSSMDSRGILTHLLSSARSLLEAGGARLVPVSAPLDEGVLRSDVDGSIAVEVTGKTAGTWDANDEGKLRALASVASNALAHATLFEQMRTITSSLGEGVIALDRAGRVEFVNPAVEDALGWETSDLIGRSLHEVVHARHHVSAGDDCLLLAALSAGVIARDEDDAFVCKDGRLLPVAHTTAPVIRDGDVVGSVIAFRDISERKAFEQELAHQAFHDTLTGLANRALFLDRLSQAHARASRTGSLYSLLFIDLDRFKVVNDSLGHQAGDQLLIEVANRLKLCVRPGDTFARFGGDEFVVLLEDLVDEEDAVTVTERILEELREPFRVEGRDVSASASIGVVIGNQSYESPDHCLRDADVAMYRAKARGKATYEVFRPEMEGAALHRLDMEIALRDAIENGELELHYQPLVSLERVSIVGLEALVRWRHPQKGMMSPADFIPLAEETGLILPIGEWVLEEACRQVREWQDAYPGAVPLVMTVNLSARQFQQPDLCDRVAAVVKKTGISPDQLCLEVTESVMMDDVDAATLMLKRLKDLGSCVAIDDFGTGYSSLSYLKRFPVDFVKIDKSFVADLGEGAVDSEIVRAVIRLAAAIGIRTVAEGVETEEQLRRLRAMGCPLVQGYYLARPQPADAIATLLQERVRQTAAGVQHLPAALGEYISAG
ncbi:MAG TPA: EAL domain-containing protein [Acidimicrobiales bacterium]|nr:EAL domain-containing protein [Acidimicrobiales bacterium]